MDYWKMQDLFHERMKMDYEGGVIDNPIYKPYFQWKFYGASVETLTKQLCYQIMKEAQKELEELDNKHPEAHNQILVEPSIDEYGLHISLIIQLYFLYSFLPITLILMYCLTSSMT